MPDGTAHYGPFSPERAEMFYAKVVTAPAPSGFELVGDCWLWTAYCDKEGYGRFHCPNFPGKKSRHILAHRWCVAFWYGVEILNGLTWDHLCLRHPCVQPLHGSAITRPANTARGNQTRHETEYDILEF